MNNVCKNIMWKLWEFSIFQQHAFEDDLDSDCTGWLFDEDERMSEAPIMVNNWAN